MAGVNLSSVFELVRDNLIDNKDQINSADTRNHDHGTDMVDIFSTITDAVQSKDGGSIVDQLEFASQLLGKKGKSGTSKIYSKGLQQASQTFTDGDLTADNALDFAQVLLGGQPSSGGGVDAGGLIGGLLGSITGNKPEGESGIDLGDVLEIGLDYLQAKQSGSSDLEALATAVLSNTLMGQAEHRAASGQVVIQSLIRAFSQSAK